MDRCVESTCTDAVDNDADGQTDCADTDCGGSAGPAGATCCNINTDCTGGLVCGASKICAESAPGLLGDTDASNCLSLTEYNNFKYEFKNGLLPDVTAEQYTNAKYEFKNNLNNIRCP